MKLLAQSTLKHSKQASLSSALYPPRIYVNPQLQEPDPTTRHEVYFFLGAFFAGGAAAATAATMASMSGLGRAVGGGAAGKGKESGGRGRSRGRGETRVSEGTGQTEQGRADKKRGRARDVPDWQSARAERNRASRGGRKKTVSFSSRAHLPPPSFPLFLCPCPSYPLIPLLTQLTCLASQCSLQTPRRKRGQRSSSQTNERKLARSFSPPPLIVEL